MYIRSTYVYIRQKKISESNTRTKSAHTDTLKTNQRVPPAALSAPPSAGIADCHRPCDLQFGMPFFLAVAVGVGVFTVLIFIVQ